MIIFNYFVFLFQNLTAFDLQSITLCIEENTEQLDLLQKTLEVEQRQKNRLLQISLQKERENENEKRKNLLDGTSTTTNSLLDQEDTTRKELVQAMVENSNQCNGPVVKVLTNLQGNKNNLPYFSISNRCLLGIQILASRFNCSSVYSRYQTPSIC